MYDNTSKLLISQFCADYTTWLLGKPVEMVDMEPTELYYEPIRADGVVLSCAVMGRGARTVDGFTRFAAIGCFGKDR
jgi:hypothetical protein